MSTLASIAASSFWRCCACPLLSGVINRTKAWFAGRRGPPLLQAYYDLLEAAAQRRGLQPTDQLAVRGRPDRRPGVRR